MTTHHARHVRTLGKHPIRDNLESTAVAVLLVLLVSQLVVEAFQIPTGSMAPTMLGDHKEIRCPDCGWVFEVGGSSSLGSIACPNCDLTWRGAASSGPSRWPAWLWNTPPRDGSGGPAPKVDAANRVQRPGTRIFVNKFVYAYRPPKRWEIVVFRCPFYRVTCRECSYQQEVMSLDEPCPCGACDYEAQRDNYVKRLVGLPGEEISILGGDVYVDGVLARKPPNVQAGMWQHVFDSFYEPVRELREPVWRLGDGAVAGEDGRIDVTAAAEGQERMVSYGRPIRDYAAYNGPDGRGGRTYVHDVRIEADLTVQDARDAADVRLRLTTHNGEFTFIVPVGGGAAALRRDDEEIGRAPLALAAGRRVRVALECYDGLVVATVDGQVVLRREYAPLRVRPGRTCGVSFGARRADATFHRVRLARDVYYLPRKDDGKSVYAAVCGPRCHGGYFMLGDNTANSRDSRDWVDPHVPTGNVIGEAFAVFWPVHDLGWLASGSD